MNKSLIYLFIYLLVYIGCIISWVYQDSRPSGPKGNCKCEILLVKIFNLKQKAKSNTSSYYRVKIKFLLFKKTVYGSFR